MEYLQVSYYSLSGIKKVIDLGDFSHGEWIIYGNSVPRFIVDLHTENDSDKLINSLINKGIETIDTIIKKISMQQDLNLSLKNPPVFRIFKEEQTINLNLTPLPILWLKSIL